MERKGAILVSIYLLVTIHGEELFGPKYRPTEGAVWPRPAQQISEPKYFTYEQGNFNIKVVQNTCDLLEKAVERYGFVVRDARRTAARLFPTPAASSDEEHHGGQVEQLHVQLTAPCEDYPHHGMLESYNLTVDAVSVLQSDSIWGILRGLETWSQLFYMTEAEPYLRINKTWIQDWPAYPHRGLLLDTSRHFLSVGKLLTTLDAMAMNKLNVFHWHIVDDQSFPYQSNHFPELSREGAFHSSMVYSRVDIQRVIQFARERGIRVLPEFDVPGHTRSWGQSHPELLTPCYSGGKVSGLGPMNPLNNDTYRLLRDLFREVQELFPERYIHLGGDEVDLDCWNSNPDLQKYMQANNLTAAQLHGLFMSRVVPLLGDSSKSIVWQEVFDEGVDLPKDTLVHMWKNDNLGPVTRAGYKVIYSTAWYLDHLASGGDWQRMYSEQPEALGEALVGGEAAMWGEVVDDTNVISRVWPRASAVAEKLWSPPTAVFFYSYYPSREVHCRLEEHACRMRRRGVGAQPPSGPGYCLGALL